MTTLTHRTVWRRETTVRARAPNPGLLTREEQDNVKAAIGVLRTRFRSLRGLAAALGIAHRSLTHAVSTKRGPTLALAYKVAQLAGVRTEDVLRGWWPRRDGVCQMCGRMG